MSDYVSTLRVALMAQRETLVRAIDNLDRVIAGLDEDAPRMLRWRPGRFKTSDGRIDFPAAREEMLGLRRKGLGFTQIATAMGMPAGSLSKVARLRDLDAEIAREKRAGGGRAVEKPQAKARRALDPIVDALTRTPIACDDEDERAGRELMEAQR